MPLSIAIMQFMMIPEKTGSLVLIFVYFVANCIRFFQGDVNAIQRLKSAQKKKNVTSYNAFSFFVGVASKFCFLLTAYHVTKCTAFFGYAGLAFLFDVFWVVALMGSLDQETKAGQTLRHTFRRWLILDVIEAAVCFGMAIAIHTMRDDPTIKEYLEYGTIGVLALLLGIDYLYNSPHYFKETKKS